MGRIVNGQIKVKGGEVAAYQGLGAAVNTVVVTEPNLAHLLTNEWFPTAVLQGVVLNTDHYMSTQPLWTYFFQMLSFLM